MNKGQLKRLRYWLFNRLTTKHRSKRFIAADYMESWAEQLQKKRRDKVKKKSQRK